METALSTNEQSHVERMADSFSEPTWEERAKDWYTRSALASKEEEQKAEGKHAPRVVNAKELENESPEYRAHVKNVGVKDESETERGATGRNEQRPDAKASESTDSRVAPNKLTQAELDSHWQKISAGGNPAWKKALEQVLGEPEVAQNKNEIIKLLATQPEALRHVSKKNVADVRTAVQQVSAHVQQQVAARESMTEVMRQASVRHPDAKEKIMAATNDVMTKAPMFVKVFVNDSEVVGELLYTLADAATLSNLLEVAKTNPGKALRVLRDMEVDVKRALSNQKGARNEASRTKPPTSDGGRAAATEDAFEGMSFGDFDRRQTQRYAHAR